MLIDGKNDQFPKCVTYINKIFKSYIYFSECIICFSTMKISNNKQLNVVNIEKKYN